MVKLFFPSSYADIRQAVGDRDYALGKHLFIGKCSSCEIRFLEEEIVALSVRHPHFHHHLSFLKHKLAEEMERCGDHNLYSVRYDRRYLTPDNLTTFGLFRFILVDRKRIVYFSPPKPRSVNIFVKDSRSLVFGQIKAYELVQGIRVGLFYDSYLMEWEMVVKGAAGGYCVPHQGLKTLTYRNMFIQAMDATTRPRPLLGHTTQLKPHHCYCLIMQHPAATRAPQPLKMRLVLTHIYKGHYNHVHLISEEETREEAERLRLELPVRIETGGSCTGTCSAEGLVKHFAQGGPDHSIAGAILHHSSGLTGIVYNPNYLHMRSLHHNSPRLQHQYYQLRKLGKVKDFLRLYPNYIRSYAAMRVQLHTLTRKLWKTYIGIYILKHMAADQPPSYLKSHLLVLHGLYLNALRCEGKSLKYKHVKRYINSLQPNKLIYLVNCSTALTKTI